MGEVADADHALLVQENELIKADVKRYANILNMTLNPVWQRDGDLRLTFCNLAFSEVAEESMDDVLAADDLELYPGHKELAQKALESGKEQREKRHIVVHGQRRLYSIREVPADGTVTGYAKDISEVDEAHEEIQQHISAQKDFLESSTSAMAIFGKDMRLMFYNFAYVNLWKLDDIWLDSKPDYGEILERLREKRKLPEQANFPAFKAQHIKLFTDLLETHEEFFYLPDGRILRMVAVPHALGGLLLAYEDVTDRLALERSYNTLIAVQRETLDNLHEGVVVFGEDGRVKLSNPAFSKIWTLDERLLNNEPHLREILELTQELYVFDDWEQFVADFVARTQRRDLQHGRMDLRDERIIDWRVVPLPDGGTLLTFTDVTDTMLVERSLREKNEALEAADKLKTEFLAHVSYELRSPLTSISGFADILRNEYFGDLTDKQREYVEGIHQSSQQLGQLINNILDLASIEAGYMQLDLSEFDVYDMMDAVLLLLKERMKILDLSIERACDPDIGNIYADETRIKQVLFNLLGNAVKYSHAGGSIEVGAVPRDDGAILIWVQDQGVGIEESKQQLVFDKFLRAGASSGQQSGTGLGLAIVKSFVELHGGNVRLQSSPNQGTRVECVLPRRAQQKEG